MKIRLDRNLWNRLQRKAEKRPLVRDTVTTSIWMVLGKSVGFLIPLFIAAWFGVNRETDSFFFVYGLVFFLSSILSVGTESIIVPFLAEKRARDEDIGAFVGNLLGVSGCALAIITAVLILLARPLFSFLTQFDPASRSLSARLFVEISPLILLMFWSSVLAGAMNAFKRFSLHAFFPAIRAVIVLLWVFLTKDRFGMHAVAVAYTIGEALRLFVYFCAIRKWKLFRIRMSLGIDAGLKAFTHTAFFQLAAITIGYMNPFIDKIMASWMGEGGVSVLHYAHRLYMIPTTLFTSGLLVTLLSHWSHKYYRIGPRQLRGDVHKALRVVFIFAAPLCACLIFLHKPLIRLLFGWGRFDPELHAQLGWTWIAYLVGLIPFSLSQIYVNAHVIMKNTRILMRISFVLFFCNIVFNLILMRLFQVAGLALATSGVSLVSAAFFILTFNRRLKTEESVFRE